MSFEGWLSETKKAIAKVESLIGSLESEAKDVQTHIKAVVAEAGGFAGAAAAVEGKGSVVERNATIASTIRRSIAVLQHDTEIVVDRNFLLAKGQIDLGHIFEPYEGEFNSKIEQAAPATLVHESTGANDLPVPGQNTLQIPIRVSLLGGQQDGAVHSNFAPRFSRSGSSRLSMTIARPPSYFGTANAAVALQIEERATRELGTSLGLVSFDIPQLDLLPTGGRFNAAWIDDHLRCLGTSARRRTRRQLLPAVPGGFDLALKFDQEYIWQIVRAEVAKQDSEIFSGPKVTGARAFSLQAGIRRSGGARVGCVDFTWTLTVKVSLLFELAVINRNVLVISGKQVGSPRVDFDLPTAIDWLLPGLERIVEAYIANKVPALEAIRQQYVVGNARQIDVLFWDAFVVFAINT